MRPFILLPLTLQLTLGFAQWSNLHARYNDLASFEEDDSSLQVRDFEGFDDLEDLYARDILEDDDSDYLQALIARVVSTQDKHIVADEVLHQQQDSARTSGNRADNAIGKSLNWMAKSSANNMAAHHAEMAGNTAAASKHNAKANFGRLLGGHYAQQAMGHAADRNRASGIAGSMRNAGVQRIQRRGFWDEE